jgi:hypothetical protein
MDQEALDLRDLVRRRYAFDEWRRRTTAPDLLFVWNLGLRGHELPELIAERLERIELPPLYERLATPAAQRVAPEAAERVVPEVAERPTPVPAARPALPRAIDTMPVAHVHTIWRHTRRSDVLLRVDVFESASLDDARDMMVWLLGECESPLIERKEGVGDIGFGERGDRVLLFCRANLVYLLRNIGRRPEDVVPVAAALDAHAISRPDTAPSVMPMPSAERVAENDAETVEQTLYDLRADPDAARSAHKFFAPQGEIRISGGRIIYRGRRAGLEALARYDLPGAAMPRRQ